jgi:hypothetical protein
MATTGSLLEGGRPASARENFGATLSTSMMFIYAYALRPVREYLYILMATEKILHLKFVCLVITSDLFEDYQPIC